MKPSGSLTNGQIVNVYEVQDGWYRVSDQCKAWAAGWYMEKIVEPLIKFYLPMVTK